MKFNISEKRQLSNWKDDQDLHGYFQNCPRNTKACGMGNNQPNSTDPFNCFFISINYLLNLMSLIYHFRQFIFAIQDIIIGTDIGNNLHHITTPDQMVGRGSSNTLQFFIIFSNRLDAEVCEGGDMVIRQKRIPKISLVQVRIFRRVRGSVIIYASKSLLKGSSLGQGGASRTIVCNFLFVQFVVEIEYLNNKMGFVR